jgi:hypothetical protein
MTEGRSLQEAMSDLELAIGDRLDWLAYAALGEPGLQATAAEFCAGQPCGGESIGYAHIGMPGACEHCRMEARLALGLIDGADFEHWAAST